MSALLLLLSAACGGGQAAERAFGETREWAEATAPPAEDGRVRIAPASAPLAVLDALPANPIAFVAWDAEALISSMLDGSWFGGAPIVQARGREAIAALVNDAFNLLWEQETGRSAGFDLLAFDQVAVGVYADTERSGEVHVLTLVRGAGAVDPEAWVHEDLWHAHAQHDANTLAFFANAHTAAWYEGAVAAAPDGRLAVGDLMPALHADALFAMGVPDTDRLPRLARLGLYQYTGGALRTLGLSLTADMGLRMVTDGASVGLLHRTLFLAHEGVELAVSQLLSMMPQPALEGALRELVDALFSRVHLSEEEHFASIDVPAAYCGAPFTNLLWYGTLLVFGSSAATIEVDADWRYERRDTDAVSDVCVGGTPATPPLESALLPWMDGSDPASAFFMTAHPGAMIAQGLPTFFGLLPFALSDAFVERHFDPAIVGLSSWSDPASAFSFYVRTVEEAPGAGADPWGMGAGVHGGQAETDVLVRVNPEWLSGISPFMLSMMGIEVVELEGVGEVLRMGFADGVPAPAEAGLPADVRAATEALLQDSWVVFLTRPNADQRSAAPAVAPFPELQPLTDAVWFPHFEYGLVSFGPTGRVSWQRIARGKESEWERWNEELPALIAQELRELVPEAWQPVVDAHVEEVLTLLREDALTTHRSGPWVAQRDRLEILPAALRGAVLGAIVAAFADRFAPWLMQDPGYDYGPWEEDEEWRFHELEEVPEEASAPPQEVAPEPVVETSALRAR